MDDSQHILSVSAILVRLAAVAALVAMNAFFVAAEFALVSVRHSRMEELASRGNILARVVLKAVSNLDRYIAGTQLGITLASLGLGWVGESTLAAILTPVLHRAGFAQAESAAHQISITIAFITITFLHVVLGELVPKSVALLYPETTALWVGKPMQVIVGLMSPFIWALNGTGNLFVRLLGMKEPPAHHHLHTVDELKILVDASHKGGMLDETERELLQRVFRFSDVTTRQVMVHRTQVKGVPVDISFDELAQVIEESPFTRIPVYEGSIDNIIGVLHLKDLFRYARKAGPDFCPRSVMHKPLFVPETLSVELLLNEFKQNRTQMAVVLDEFGGTAGVVTLKDVLDEIVGHVHEEYEEDEPEIVEGEDGTIWLQGHVRIDDLNAKFDLALEEPDADTVGGLVMTRLGRMPLVGDVVEENGARFRVEAVHGLRISRVAMQLAQPAARRNGEL
ncbi:MAG TPA: hemolysin family protein [Armatimonadota bacterium]|nr:hemolysin family protein [Armatimonadota bacterium]HPO74546.1 hemolysin family protein [Armatimonadota bacterium]